MRGDSPQKGASRAGDGLAPFAPLHSWLLAFDEISAPLIGRFWQRSERGVVMRWRAIFALTVTVSTLVQGPAHAQTCINVDYDTPAQNLTNTGGFGGPYRGQSATVQRPIGEHLDGQLYGDVIRSVFVTDNILAPINDIEFGWHVHPGDQSYTVFLVYHVNGTPRHFDLGTFNATNVWIDLVNPNGNFRWQGFVDGTQYLDREVNIAQGDIAGVLAERHNSCDEAGVYFYNLQYLNSSGNRLYWTEISEASNEDDPDFDCFKSSTNDTWFKVRDLVPPPTNSPKSPCTVDVDPI